MCVHEECNFARPGPDFVLQREWGTPIVMEAAVKAKIDVMWGELGL
jgi:hypothetical protein